MYVDYLNEWLYVPKDKEEKYRVSAFIDKYTKDHPDFTPTEIRKAVWDFFNKDNY